MEKNWEPQFPINSFIEFHGKKMGATISYNHFIKFHGKKIGSHNITVLYPNPCYNGTARYIHFMSTRVSQEGTLLSLIVLPTAVKSN